MEWSAKVIYKSIFNSQISTNTLYNYNYYNYYTIDNEYTINCNAIHGTLLLKKV
jgi:hypothetical protein